MTPILIKPKITAAGNQEKVKKFIISNIKRIFFLVHKRIKMVCIKNVTNIVIMPKITAAVK